MSYIESVAFNTWHHFSVMTPVILAFALLKLVFPIISYLLHRFSEYRFASRLMKNHGFTEEDAKGTAREFYRKPLPKWLKKLINTFRKNHHP